MCRLPQAVWAMPGPILRGSLRFEKQLAHTLFEFVLFGALPAFMFFLGMAGLGAGDFPFGFGGLLRLVRPAVRFLSCIVLCCSCSLSSHCWKAICKHDCQIISPLYAIKLISELMKCFLLLRSNHDNSYNDYPPLLST